ncbi:hypothetical protein GFS31_43760 (plasmid) [Leptolyngbya sp. BL0902]|nr:hypothetical protein GFS31_43760 [Leptolyngbya sp. BL0902]
MGWIGASFSSVGIESSMFQSLRGFGVDWSVVVEGLLRGRAIGFNP